MFGAFDWRWLTVVGLVLDVLGVCWLAKDLFISKEKAIELGGSRYSGGTPEKNLELPQVRDRLLQSKNAKIGLFLLILGFVLQLCGSWPR